MGFLARIFGLSDRKFSPQLRAELEAEGIVLMEEGLRGSLRYHRFKAPGRYFDGKITPEGMALGVSEERFVVYGRAKLVSSPFSNPNLQAAEITADENRLVILIDYDRLPAPKTSGQVQIRINTPSAALIAREVHARMA